MVQPGKHLAVSMRTGVQLLSYCVKSQAWWPVPVILRLGLLEQDGLGLQPA